MTGFKPLLSTFSTVLPTQRWEGVPFRSRLAELGGAFMQLEELHGELARAHKTGDSLAKDWSGRLWNVRRNYHITGFDALQTEHAAIEMALEDVVGALIAAEKSIRNDEDPTRRDVLLVVAEQNLKIAADRLGIQLP